MKFITAEFVKKHIPKRTTDAHKGSFGRVLNIGGSSGMSGALALSTLAALRSGSGIVTAASIKEVLADVKPLTMEALTLALPQTDNGGIAKEAGIILSQSACSVMAVGCGMGLTEDSIHLVKYLIENAAVPLIIDADGINALSHCIDIVQTAKVPIVITPHPGEMGRLLDLSARQINADREKHATTFAQKYNCTVVLKGAGTLVANADGQIYQNTTGNPGMARGGSGDVLTGIITAMVAQGLTLPAAACCGVYLHGLAGDIAAECYTQQAMLPRDIISSLPDAFRRTLAIC